MAREKSPAERVGAEPPPPERRSFLWKAGATLSATLASATAVSGVPRMGRGAGTGSAADASRHALSRRLGALEDRDAIAALHHALGRAIDAGRYEELAALLAPDAAVDFHGALGAEPCPTLVLDRPAPGQEIRVAVDRRSAEARFTCLVRMRSSLAPQDSASLGSLAEMARQQGQANQVWWERGTLDNRYVRVRGAWKIQRLAYRTLERARSPLELEDL
ncbi:MAG: nuclear transport factor 2 family protein [Steroidobacteraceae bacterium]